MQCFLLAPVDPHICGRLALSFLPTEPPASISGSVKYYLTDIQAEVIRRDTEWCVRENISKRISDTAMSTPEIEIGEIIDYFGIVCPSPEPIRIFSEKNVAQALCDRRKTQTDMYSDLYAFSEIAAPLTMREEADIICITTNTCAETSFTKTLYSLVVNAICRQKRGGVLVLKLSDTFTLPTIEILALLSSFYTTVHLAKPKSCNRTGSDKYAVCQNFIGASSDYKKKMVDGLLEMGETCINTYAARLLSVEVSMNFVSRIEMCNIMMGKCQIEHIHNILLNIDKHAPRDPLPADGRYIGSGESRSWHWSTSKTYREPGHAYFPNIKHNRKTKSRVRSR
jgi:FtsJ-like methyltransferase